jgi:hypothetical protein
LDAFHQALKEQEEAQAKAESEAAEAKEKEKSRTTQFGVSGGGGGSSGSKVLGKTAAAVTRKPKITAIVKPKRTLGSSKDGITGEENVKKQKVDATHDDGAAGEDGNNKKEKVEEVEEEEQGLAGLLVGYGSSDSD